MADESATTTTEQVQNRQEESFSPGVERRFRELTQERTQLRDSLAAMEASLKSLQEQQRRHVMERDLWQADYDYDDDILDFLELKHSKAKDDAGNQPAFGRWLGEYAPQATFLRKRTIAQAKSEEAPAPPRPKERVVEPVERISSVKTPPPKTPAGHQPSAAATQLSEDQILSMAKHDPRAYGEWRKQRGRK